MFGRRQARLKVAQGGKRGRRRTNLQKITVGTESSARGARLEGVLPPQVLQLADDLVDVELGGAPAARQLRQDLAQRARQLGAPRFGQVLFVLFLEGGLGGRKGGSRFGR